MSRTRFSINERGELVRRDGTVAGRVVSITLDMDGEGGQGGGAEAAPPTKDSSEEGGAGGSGDGKLFEAPDQTKLVWEHYQATVDGANRRKLDSTRLACIRRALKVRSLDECKEAISGLAASPHHNGQNDQQLKYLDIQYALGQKSESPDERIDKARGWAHRHGESLSGGAGTFSAVIATLSSKGPYSLQQFARDLLNAGKLDELRARFGIERLDDGTWRKVEA